MDNHDLITVEPLCSGPLGELHFGHYNIRVAFIDGLFCTTNWDLGFWPYIYRGGLYSGVAVKRGSSVYFVAPREVSIRK